MSAGPPGLAWVVLTIGNRPDELAAAIDSLVQLDRPGRVVLVDNSAGTNPSVGADVDCIVAGQNLGVPGGRDLGVRSTDAEIIGFLDDDATVAADAGDRIRDAFAADDRLGAVALRIVDPAGATQRRHVPRLGRRHPSRRGDVALFLGGACAIRRLAYDDAGGYFVELFYGHEEVELCWRLVDRGWRIEYLAEVEVVHPPTEIGRHPDGWALTGRNRVWIARRTLPWPIAIAHVAIWLAIGVVRAPGNDARRAYVRGWLRGWRGGIGERRPIRWRTVWRLTRLGRPPIV